MQNRFVSNIVFPSTIFVSAACGLTIEIVAGRLLAPIFGMSLYTWTSVIAVVLAGLSIGHWIGGKLTTIFTATETQLNSVGIALTLSSVSSISILFLIGNFLSLNTNNIEIITLILLSSAGLFFLPSLFVGIVSPIITNLAVASAPTSKTGLIIGRMFALSSSGAIFGALLTGYILISTFGTRQTIFIVSASYAILAILYFGLARRLKTTSLVTTLFIFLASVWLIERSGINKSTCYRETNYFCIQLQEIGPPGSDVKLMALDHLVHSINDKNDARLIHSPYLHFVDELVDLHFANLEAPSVFLIGGGGFTLPRAWVKKYNHKAKLYISEIDPEVTQIAKESMWFQDSSIYTKIIHGDARLALRELQKTNKFNIIFGDAFHDISIPQHLVTKEFNDLVKSHLKKDGIYIVNVVDSSAKPLFLLSLVKTLNSTFSNVQVWFEPAIKTDTGQVTYSVVASDNPVPHDLIVSSYGFERIWWLWSSSKLYNSKLYSQLPILTDDFAPVDRLMSEVLLKKFP